MGNPIKFTELVDKGDVEAGFNGLIDLYKKLEKDAKKSISGIKEATKGIVPTSKGAAEAIRSQSQQFRTQKQVVDESQKAIRTLTTAQQKLKTAQTNVGIETAKVRDAISRQNRLTRQAITLSRSNKGSMTALNIELGKNRQRYRALSAAQRANVNVGGKLLTTIKQQDTNLKKLDASIGNNQRSVGKYGIALQGATRLLGALGLAGGIALVVRGVREMIGVFAGFEKQMAKVRAISGATDEEFKLLTDDAKRLGESTEKTASQVGELQLAYAKLGFTVPQIVAATEATLDLATATDEDLAQSALVAAKTIKGFNLTAEETVRVTDVMAASFSMSALNLNTFQDAMKTVAPVALAVNSSLESTTAILSTLVDAGLEASTAGTSLRNIFIELAKQGITWEDAMEQVRNSTNKLKTATELFGKRASTAALIIADNTDKIDSLTISYENAEGSAKAMADIMRDVLIGDVDKARSVIQALSILIGEKLTPFLRGATQAFTSLIRRLNEFLGGTKEVTKTTAELTNESTKFINTGNDLIKTYEELIEKETLTSEEKRILDDVTNDLIKTFGSSVAIIDEETGALTINIEAIKLQIKTRAALQSEQITQLLAEQLSLETQIKRAEQDKEFIKTQKERRDLSITLQSILNLDIDLFKTRTKTETELLFTTKNLTEQEKLLLEQINKARTSILGEEFAKEKLRKVNEALLASGIDLDLLAQQQLESIKKTIKSTGDDNKSKDENLTRLKELQKLLKEQRLALESIVDETTEASEVAITTGKAEIKVTQEKIDAILKVLSLKEEEKKKDKEKFESLKLEEGERVFQLELQERLLKGEIERHDFVIESAKLRIDAIDFLMEKEIEGTEAFKKLEIEKLELLKDIEDEKKAIRRKEAEEIKELADIAVNGIIEGLERRADAAIKTANTEIQATEKQISRQEALAAQGLENSLKFEQEQRAKALLAKIEAEKQKQTAEKISAFWNLVANSENVLEAIRKFAIGEAFARTIEALPGFEEGDLTPEKESIIKVSEKGSEFIVKHGPAQQYLPQLRAMNEGTYDNQLVNYIDNSRFIPQNIPTNDMQVQQLVLEMKAMRNEFKNSMPRVESYFDASTKEMINTIKYKNSKKIIHYKLPSL